MDVATNPLALGIIIAAVVVLLGTIFIAALSAKKRKKAEARPAGGLFTDEAPPTAAVEPQGSNAEMEQVGGDGGPPPAPEHAETGSVDEGLFPALDGNAQVDRTDALVEASHELDAIELSDERHYPQPPAGPPDDDTQELFATAAAEQQLVDTADDSDAAKSDEVGDNIEQPANDERDDEAHAHDNVRADDDFADRTLEDDGEADDEGVHDLDADGDYDLADDLSRDEEEDSDAVDDVLGLDADDDDHIAEAGTDLDLSATGEDSSYAFGDVAPAHTPEVNDGDVSVDVAGDAAPDSEDALSEELRAAEATESIVDTGINDGPVDLDSDASADSHVGDPNELAGQERSVPGGLAGYEELPEDVLATQERLDENTARLRDRFGRVRTTSERITDALQELRSAGNAELLRELSTDMEGQLTDANNELTDMFRQLVALESDIARKQQDTAEAERHRQELRHQLTQLEEQVWSLDDRRRSLQNDIDSLQMRRERMRDEALALEESIGRLNHEIGDMQQRITPLERELAEAQALQDEVQGSYDHQRAEYDERNARFKEVADRVTELSDQLVVARDGVATLRTEKRLLAEQVVSLDQRRDELDASIVEQQGELARMNEQHGVVQGEIESLRADVKARDLTNLETEAKLLSDQVTRRQHDLGRLDRTRNGLADELERLAVRRKELDGQKASLSGFLDQVDEQRRDVQRSINALRDNREELNASIIEAESETQQMRFRADQAREEIQRLENEREGLRDDLETAQERKEGQDRTREEATNAFDGATSDLRRAEEAMEEAYLRLQSMNGQLEGSAEGEKASRGAVALATRVATFSGRVALLVEELQQLTTKHHDPQSLGHAARGAVADAAGDLQSRSSELSGPLSDAYEFRESRTDEPTDRADTEHLAATLGLLPDETASLDDLDDDIAPPMPPPTPVGSEPEPEPVVEQRRPSVNPQDIIDSLSTIEVDDDLPTEEERALGELVDEQESKEADPGVVVMYDESEDDEGGSVDVDVHVSNEVVAPQPAPEPSVPSAHAEDDARFDDVGMSDSLFLNNDDVSAPDEASDDGSGSFFAPSAQAFGKADDQQDLRHVAAAAQFESQQPASTGEDDDEGVASADEIDALLDSVDDNPHS